MVTIITHVHRPKSLVAASVRIVIFLYIVVLIVEMDKYTHTIAGPDVKYNNLKWELGLKTPS